MKVVLSLLGVFPALAGEYAVLHNGFRIHAERHETIGDSVRLHTASGSMDVPSREVARFEVEEYFKPTETAKPAPEPAQTAPVPAPTDPKQLISDAAQRNGLLPEFVHSVAASESSYRITALSPKGAIGLMQLMPFTAKELGANPHDPAENADAGARYLKQLLLKYKDTKDPVRLALAAYNAGPGAVDKYDGIPPYRETQQYIERVLRKYLAALSR
jgi:soluble lytic murein transglycosylase-like protein